MADLTPYSTTEPWQHDLPQWASVADKDRVASYQLYEELYWQANNPLELSQNGTTEQPIQLPVARSIVEATHRFLAVGWDIGFMGSNTDDANLWFTKLSKREKLKSKVSAAKRWGLIRGDALFHVVANPAKEQGSRLSIFELDPASYFPITDINNPDRITGAHIIEFVTEGRDQVIKRQTYRKVMDVNGNDTGVVTSETALYELAGWDDRYTKPEDIKLVRVIQPPMPLPAPITTIPIYHWKNTTNTSDPFGSSLLRGLERMVKGIEQTITDQDLAVALAGLGVYATDSGHPVDDDNEPTDWIIGPGRVVETSQGSKFYRVTGVGSIEPSLAHAKYLEEKAREGASVPALAVGDVDVQTAESGIALSIRLAPLLSSNAERELDILGVIDQMLFDLQTMWFPAYEQLTFADDVVVFSMVKDPMPENRDTVIAETLSLYDDDLITLDMAVKRLTKLGWDYPADALAELDAQKSARAALTALADPFAARAGSELNGAQPPAPVA